MPYSRPSFPSVHSPRGEREPSSSSSMSSRGSGGRRRGEGISGSRRNPEEISLNTVGAFQTGEEQLEVRLCRGHRFPLRNHCLFGAFHILLLIEVHKGKKITNPY